jgi:hypothetical protein
VAAQWWFNKVVLLGVVKKQLSQGLGPMAYPAT